MPKGINFPLGAPTGTGAGGRPGIAFDGANFLFVYRGGDGAAWGKRVSPSGVVLDGSGFKIGTNSGAIREASVAFDGTNYMVVWELDVAPTEIYAARVTPQGTVLDSPEIQVTNGASAYPRPVATTFDGDNFLLVFRTAGSPFPTFGMRGLRMSKTGQSLDGPTGFPIFDGPAAYVSTAYDPVHQVHLAVWEDRRKVGTGEINPTLDVDISGMRISKAGTVLDANPILISTETVDGAIQAPALEQRAPGVGFNGTNFLVAWYDARPEAIAEVATVYGARVAADGTVLDQPSFQIGDNYSSQDATQTPVICDDTDCLVVWMYESSRGYGAGYGYRGGIYTKRVTPSGQVYDRGIAASANFGAGFFPMAGVGNGNVLVVWGDQRDGAPVSFYAQIMERGAGPAPPPLQPGGENQPASLHYSGLNTSDFVTGIGGMDERHPYAVTLSGDAYATNLWRLPGGNVSTGWVIEQQYRMAGNRLYALTSTAPDFVWATGQNTGTLYKVPLGRDWFFCCANGSVLAVQAFGTPRNAPNGIQVFSVGTKGLRQRFTIHPESFDLSYSKSILGENSVDYADPPLDLGGVWGSSPTNVYAVGEFGTVLHYDGTAWSKVANIPTLEALNAVWGSASHVFAAGDFGTVLHWDGTSWTVMETGTAEHLYGIWGFNANDIYAVGTHYSVFHYDGTAWHRLFGGSGRLLLREVWGAGNRVFVAGESGQLNYFDVPGYNPTPGLNSVQPTSAIARSPGFTLNVNGDTFQANSTVRWNGVNRPTTFDNSGHLTASINDADLASPAVALVSVFTPGPGGGTSQVLPFTIQAQPAVTFNSSLNFGNVLIGTSSPQQNVTVNSTGTAALQIASIGASGDFVQQNDCPQSLVIGSSCTIHVNFMPGAAGVRTGYIGIAHNAPGQNSVALTGTGVAPLIQVSPLTLDFGSVTVGSNGNPQPFTVTNNGTANLPINQIFTTGDYTQSNNCPGQLNPSQSCTVNVTFTPGVLGNRAGQAFVAYNAIGSPSAVGLSGTGVTGPLPHLSLSTGSLLFGPVVAGMIGSPLPVTISNSGATDLHIYGIFAEAEWPFTSCGEVLTVNASCTIQVFSRPNATGTRSGTLRILSNAPGSPHQVNLNGFGASLIVERPLRSARPAIGAGAPGLSFSFVEPMRPSATASRTIRFAIPEFVLFNVMAEVTHATDEETPAKEENTRKKEQPSKRSAIKEEVPQN